MIICSALFLVSISLRFFSSSALLASASFTIRSISSSDNPVEFWITIDCSFWVFKSLALTFTIPLTSIEKVTSIWGTPLGAGSIPSNLNKPNCLLSLAIDLSPCNTLISTAGWLSAAVENTCDLVVGIVVFLSINTVITPPIVSIPNESGVTSNNKTSLTSPAITPPWIAAPIDTTSSGFTDLLGSFPSKRLTDSWTAGIRVDPPTNNTWSISLGCIPASLNACLTGPSVATTKSLVISSNLALVNDNSKCNGPAAPAEMNGNEIWVCITPDKSFLAFSAASLIRCIAILSLDKSILFSFLNSSTM